MSGLIALLDDVVALSKVAAASVDDIAGMAAKAGSKAAGVVIDDAAVTPKYVTGLDAKRELPIIWKIARSSFFNKLVILLPAALLMKAFAPWLITPLLMLGGMYLCFEGAEKVWHVLAPHKDSHVHVEEIKDPAQLEETRVRGAIKTDFILSAEIMTISLAAIPDATFAMEAITLAIVAIGITALVYGSVALIVKADDVGIWLTANAPTPVGRTVGKGLVRGMPYFLKALAFVGTLAMLWVGGSILVHGLHDLGIDWPYDPIKHLAENFTGFVNWAVTAGLDGVFGVVIGLALIPVVTKILKPMFGKEKAAH